MARAQSKADMGYFPVPDNHHEAILSLVAPATPASRILDPFAGDGLFLEKAAAAWQLTPYANELDASRAGRCIDRFGPTQAVRGDANRLRASNRAFGLGWFNPPYDHDRTAAGSKRVEFAMLRHAWKWIQTGGIVMWCVYQHHVTDEAMAFIANNSQQADLWTLSGKHLDAFHQVVLVAVKGTTGGEMAIYNHLSAQKQEPHWLTVQDEPLYRLPRPDTSKRFYFAPDNIDAETGQRLIAAHGAWANQTFQNLLAVPVPPTIEQPVVTPRPGHTALVLSAGIANGAVLDTVEHGRVALRSTIETREEVARVTTEPDMTDPDHTVTKTTMRLRPATQMTLLSENGDMVELEGDEALLGFIRSNRQVLARYLNTRFDPLYNFDFAGIRPYLDRIRLKGKYELYTPQKHVVAATIAGFRERKGQLLIGQMGVGKTAIASSAAIAIAGQVVRDMAAQIRPDQVTLIVCPPHLVDKWRRELYSIHQNIVVEHLQRHEDVKAFMQKAATIGAGIPKIGLIKRTMTKLGSGFRPAVYWRTTRIRLWKKDEPVPEDFEAHERIQVKRIPQCPHCGTTVTYERRGNRVIASKKWLKEGKRICATCYSPLWEQKRDRGSALKAGERFPTKNPRWRLDQYIKRFYADRVHLLIWDEVHEAANADSGNGAAFGRLAGIADKVLGLTGTPFNGKASSLFNLEYHLNPRTRQVYPWGGAPRLAPKERGAKTHRVRADDGDSLQRGRAESRWVKHMGVREQVLEDRPTYNKAGQFTGTHTYQRPYEEAPGCSPRLVGWLLGHSIFFSLKDLGKYLPTYTEIAYPVEMDGDIASRYDSTQQVLKEYLISRKWEGDNSFRGAYLQWSMGWVNACYRPMKVIHNRRDAISRTITPHVVTRIPSYDSGDRIFAKEQALIDLVTDRLQNNRPVVIYLRQTGTRNIQPRIEALIRQHVPDAQPYVLKSSVGTDRRETVIQQQVESGCNVLICNPELVKTGLDLLHFPTLIFYEITFNLSTMLQASSRSYRLNQTSDLCEVIYMFYTDTMEHRAVQLMSRKQRAAKILTGDTGLTGLDALTEGEGGMEQALLNAITSTDALVDPRDLFKQDVVDDAITDDDNAFWHVDDTAEDNLLPLPEQMPDRDNRAETLPSEAVAASVTGSQAAALAYLADLLLSDDELDRLIAEIETSESIAESTTDMTSSIPDTHRIQHRYVSQYLDTVVRNRDRYRTYLPELLRLIREGVWDDKRDVRKVAGILEPFYLQSESMQKRLKTRVRSFLKLKLRLSPDDLDNATDRVLELSLMAFRLIPLRLTVFDGLRVNRKKELFRGQSQSSASTAADNTAGNLQQLALL